LGNKNRWLKGRRVRRRVSFSNLGTNKEAALSPMPNTPVLSRAKLVRLGSLNEALSDEKNPCTIAFRERSRDTIPGHALKRSEKSETISPVCFSVEDIGHLQGSSVVSTSS
jgi:hypothetical protein